MLTPFWQMDAVVLETIFIFPVYIGLLFDIWISRNKRSVFKSPYYTLVMSQGIADILTVVIFIQLILARYFSIGNELTFSLEDYGAASFHSNTGPLLFTIRMFGVFLITAQRYVAVCRHGGYLNMLITEMHPMILVGIHWLVPFLIYTPAFMVSNAHFDNAENLFIINTKMHMQTFSIIVVSSFLICGIVVVFMYLSILRALCMSKKNAENHILRHRSMRYQEVRLAVHVFLLSIMSLITFGYYLMEFILANSPVDSGRRSLRIYYPIVSGNFSFINPVTLLLLNRDIQKMLRAQFCLQKMNLQVTDGTTTRDAHHNEHNHHHV